LSEPSRHRNPKRAAGVEPSATARGRRRAQRDPAAATQAARHSKIRHDHSQEIAEDYVELIAQLMSTIGEARTVDIAERLGVSHVTVTKRIARLQKAGLVSSRPYRSIFLTGEGKTLAQRAAERHDLVVRFLHKLGVNPVDADADAEGIEHHVSAATMEAIRRFVEGG
jgi:DtxR family manganese transport transcriptional regulator